MFTVKQRSVAGDSVVSRHFTEWEAQEAADDLNKVLGAGVCFVEEK